MKKIIVYILACLILFSSCSSDSSSESEKSKNVLESSFENEASDGSESSSEEESKEEFEDSSEITTSPKDPIIDGVPTKIIDYLKDNGLLLKFGEDENSLLTKAELAANSVFVSGFYANFDYYYSLGDYSDIERFSDESKFAEIAVNQGYLRKGESDAFCGENTVSYEDVIRSYLYVLGYREYADEIGYMEIAASIGLSEHIDSEKKADDSVSWGEYAQITYNAFHISIVQCIE